MPSSHRMIAATVHTATPFWDIIKGVVVSSLPRFVAGFGFFLLFFLIGFIIKWVVCWGKKQDNHQYMVRLLIGRFCRLLFILLGVIVGLSTAGVGTASLVTSLGLVGFAAAYAMKDTLSNIVAGASLILNETVKPGDEITVSNNTGKVIELDLKYTYLENDTAKILVPNSILYTNISSISKNASQ